MHAAAVPYTYPGCRRALPCSYSWEYAATTGMDAGSQHADASAGCFIHALCDFLNWPSAGSTNSCNVFSVQLSVRLCGGGCSPPLHRCWVVVSGKADEVVWLFQPEHFYLVLNIRSGKLDNSQNTAFPFCMVQRQQWNGNKCKRLFIMYITFNVIERKEILNSVQEYWDFLATKWPENTRSHLIQALVKNAVKYMCRCANLINCAVIVTKAASFTLMG